MKILCVAQIEENSQIDNEIFKQTVQPDKVVWYIDNKPAKGIANRRKRISENHEHLRNIVNLYEPDLVWQVEGDCELPENTLETLLADYEKLKNDNFGYVSGIQVGRHGLYCLGAWLFNSNRTEFVSIDHNLTGLQQVDATGFYCLLAPKDVWLKGKCKWNGEHYGPDVNFGLSIPNKKYVNMDLHIGHKVKNGIIRPSDMSTCNARFYLEDNIWKFQQLD